MNGYLVHDFRSINEHKVIAKHCLPALRPNIATLPCRYFLLESTYTIY